MRGTSIKELISGRLIHVNAEDNIIKAAQLMRDNNISSLLVRHGEDFNGIVTEKDIISQVVAEELYPGDVRVEEIMSTDLVTISQEEGIERAAELMKKKNIRRLVVVDGERVAGIITETDITRHLAGISL